MKPVISIVIPTYNRAEDLKRALNSVITQTFTNWEAIVVDNHSSDNTDEIIKNFYDPRIKLFKIHNQGIIASSRNLGIKQSVGEYVAFLDSDDWWTSTKLELSLRYLEDGMDIVYHELFIVKNKNQKFYIKKTPTRNFKNKNVFNELIIHGNGLSNSSVVVRKKYLESIGGLSNEPNLVAMEDYDAWLRIAKLTQKFYKIPKVLGFYWVGGGNITNTERLLRYIDAFEQRYKKELDDLDLNKKIYWTIYAKGRAHFLLGANKVSMENLRLIHFKNVPLFIYLKSLWMLLQIKIRLA